MPHKPFPLHAQYIPAVQKAREEAGEQDAKGDLPGASDQETEHPAKTRAGEKGPECLDQPDAPKWEYGKKKTEFVKRKRADGLSYIEAIAVWDDSYEKAELLGPVPLAELKKRRFLNKDCLENPWQKKLEGSKGS